MSVSIGLEKHRGTALPPAYDVVFVPVPVTNEFVTLQFNLDLLCHLCSWSSLAESSSGDSLATGSQDILQSRKIRNLIIISQKIKPLQSLCWRQGASDPANESQYISNLLCLFFVPWSWHLVRTARSFYRLKTSAYSGSKEALGRILP